MRASSLGVLQTQKPQYPLTLSVDTLPPHSAIKPTPAHTPAFGEQVICCLSVSLVVLLSFTVLAVAVLRS